MNDNIKILHGIGEDVHRGGADWVVATDKHQVRPSLRREWKKTGGTPVFLMKGKTKEKHCEHQLPERKVLEWLENKMIDEDLCQLCNKFKHRTTEAINRRIEKRGGVYDSAMVGKNGGEDEGKMEVEGEEEEEELERSSPPSYLVIPISFKYGVRPTPFSDALKIGESKLLRGQAGVFATRRISAGSNVGLYTGVPLFTQGEVDASRSVYLLDVDVWDHWVALDGANSWAGKMNHMWDFPIYEEDDPEMEVRDEEFLGVKKEVSRVEYLAESFDPYFSNVTVEKGGTVKPTRTLNKEEELFIDYGLGFWKRQPIFLAPVWDLRGAPKSLISAILNNRRLRKLFNTSKPLMTGRDQKILGPYVMNIF